MQYLRKVFILLLMFHTPLQGKKELEDKTRYKVYYVKEVKFPFLRHTEGCRAIGIVCNRLPDNQVLYGLYYHMHLSPSVALRFSGGISPVQLNYKKHIRWVIAPSFFYTFFSTHADHYIGLSLDPMVEYGPYQAIIFGLPDRKGWDIRVALLPRYTFYFHKDWGFCIGIGACIGFLKNKGASGVMGLFN